LLLSNNKGDTMSSKYSQAWADAIRKLRTKYKMTLRDMAKFTDDAVSHGQIHSWDKDGRLPTYEDAEKFLVFFPEERVELMKIAGHPIPKEWLSEMSDAEAIETVLDKKLDPIDIIVCDFRQSGNMTEEQAKVAEGQVRQFIDKMKKEYGIE
jgi:transcriptional regulator with XRE-family HTH domain